MPLLLLFVAQAVMANENDEPDTLSFGFISNPPGERHSIGTHRLHLVCRGSGPITVWFEAGLGGSSLEWEPVIDVISHRVRACSYDRSGYAWSDPSPLPRTVHHLAREADKLLDAADIQGPLILVGHSFGGFVVRMLASRRPESVAGMLLLDSSHEEQFRTMEADGGTPMMPTTDQFVISPNSAPEGLPVALQRKVMAFARMRKTYAATHGEMASFRESARQVSRHRRLTGAVDFPLRVVRRGEQLFPETDAGRRKYGSWISLQQDLATLSTRGSLVVAESSGHHVHVDQPELVAEILLDLADDIDTSERAQ